MRTSDCLPAGDAVAPTPDGHFSIVITGTVTWMGKGQYGHDIQDSTRHHRNLC